MWFGFIVVLLHAEQAATAEAGLRKPLGPSHVDVAQLVSRWLLVQTSAMLH
jgi:hypothetical protein